MDVLYFGLGADVKGADGIFVVGCWVNAILFWLWLLLGFWFVVGDIQVRSITNVGSDPDADTRWRWVLKRVVVIWKTEMG